jgi:hypothetical protein
MRNLILTLLLISTQLSWSFEGQSLCEKPVELTDTLLVCDSAMYEIIDSKLGQLGMPRLEAKKLTFFGIELEKLGIDKSLSSWGSRYYKIVEGEKLHGYREGMFIGKKDYGPGDFIIGTYFNAEGKFLGAQIE